jgi:hypothetical protein
VSSDEGDGAGHHDSKHLHVEFLQQRSTDTVSR